jgi:hypothetical protein
MFLAAVLIHWRVADTIPMVAYVTFLDLFMIITYAMLVLVSGILILRFTEAKDQERVLVSRGEPMVDSDHPDPLDIPLLSALPFAPIIEGNKLRI